MTPAKITVQEMSGHIAARAATPLLPSGVPGPVAFEGRWWAIPDGETNYEPITTREIADRLTDLAERHARATHAAAPGPDETGAPR